MDNNEAVKETLSEVEHAILREMWYVDGRSDALRYAWDCGRDLAQLLMKLKEVEARINNPSPSMAGPLAPGASPRIYQDGYLKGLKDAISIISTAAVAVEEKQAV